MVKSNPGGIFDEWHSVIPQVPTPPHTGDHAQSQSTSWCLALAMRMTE
jgi:hypothetical protein